MDDRKRGYEVVTELNDQKRARPSGDMGMMNADVTSRIGLSRTDFAKVIGKGGQTIANIRAKCGAAIKGTEVSEEKRLVIISGSFPQVVEAFDLVSDILYTNHLHSTPTEPFTFHVLIDHAKAGRVVGPKGSNIQALKSRSGASQVRVVKDPEDMNGIQLREILIEGSLQAIRRVHFHILELFYDINLMLLATSGIPIHRGSTLYEMITSQSPQPFGAPPGFMGSSSPPRPPVIPISTLQSIGLHSDVVTRLRELQSYLNQFGLDLQVLDSRPQMPPIGFPPGDYHHPHASSASSHGGGGGLSHSLSTASLGGGGPDGSRKLEFYIPRETVGGLIGRGGQGLRDLMHETGCKIYIDKTEMDGARLVRVISNVPPGSLEEEANLQFAKDIIIKRVNEIKDNTHGDEYQEA